MTTQILRPLEAGDTPSPVRVSFEFFPPKNVTMWDQFRESCAKLATLSPEFMSVTCGAGGSSLRDLTQEVVAHIQHETDIAVAAHLTCAGVSKDAIAQMAEGYLKRGVTHIVALRGDIEGGGDYVPHPEGYAYADSLVEGLKTIGDFEISVAAYPEMHPQAKSLEDDILHLKRKQDAGADRAITQYFFNCDDYFYFVEKATQAGVTIPIVPGILPIHNIQKAIEFSQRCGANVPVWLKILYEEAHPESLTHDALSVMIASEQCRILIEAGVKELHFYTLNRAELSLAICHTLGVKSVEDDKTI